MSKSIKQLDNSDLYEEVQDRKEILELCVIGILNEEYRPYPSGLYHASQSYFEAAEELRNRFFEQTVKP